jgi:hypothetical protein
MRMGASRRGVHLVQLSWYVQAPRERHRRFPGRLSVPAGSPVAKVFAGETAFLGQAEPKLGISYSGLLHVEARRYVLGEEPCVYALLTRHGR